MQPGRGYDRRLFPGRNTSSIVCLKHTAALRFSSLSLNNSQVPIWTWFASARHSCCLHLHTKQEQEKKIIPSCHLVLVWFLFTLTFYTPTNRSQHEVIQRSNSLIKRFWWQFLSSCIISTCVGKSNSSDWGLCSIITFVTCIFMAHIVPQRAHEEKTGYEHFLVLFCKWTLCYE